MKIAHPFKLALICGGPSLERGISLNSARSVMDHLKSPSIEIFPVYVDSSKQFYLISSAQLYSNTPADFDFKLSQTAARLNPKDLEEFFKSVDLVFPVVHGAFGEDGELQSMLECMGVPFVGNSSDSCRRMFHKDEASKALKKWGFRTLPQIVFQAQDEDLQKKTEDFFSLHQLKRGVVKPAACGSSIGVHSVRDAEDACERINEVFEKGLSTHAIMEPFCEGTEFTVVVFENLQGSPVALIPTEVETSYEEGAIFDYRKKYLPTNQAAFHTPPRFSEAMGKEIRCQAEEIFKLFGMRDFVRMDGWILKGDSALKEGGLYFTDFNPFSGLEQNSFFFRQASLIGMTHKEALEFVLKRALSRYGLTLPLQKAMGDKGEKMPVFVLFGSSNAERQVSLMSGTNVWLKLLKSQHCFPIPFLFDPQGKIWELPYPFTLNHTVEEIYLNCLSSQLESGADNESWQEAVFSIQRKLGIETPKELKTAPVSLNLFLERAKENKAFVFIALHGGEGENGVLQRQLESHQIPFNGSNSKASALCMDKYLTGQAIEKLCDPDLLAVPKKCIRLDQLKALFKNDAELLWQKWCEELSSTRLIVKPRFDGCSAGIALLQSSCDLERYCAFLLGPHSYIPPFSFAGQSQPIEMPSSVTEEFLLEPYIETDPLAIASDQVIYSSNGGWLELTIGVLEEGGVYRAMHPSITVAAGAILSLEEKFQGGTGVNLTPPPPEILSSPAIQKIMRLAEKAAMGLGIENYARLDIFFNRSTEKMIVIEANSLPALTPSTAIFHQGFAENPMLSPLDLLEKIISSKLQTHGK